MQEGQMMAGSFKHMATRLYVALGVPAYAGLQSLAEVA